MGELAVLALQGVSPEVLEILVDFKKFNSIQGLIGICLFCVLAAGVAIYAMKKAS